MPNCSAIGCYNNQKEKIPGRYFHRYPADPIMRFKWILAVRRSNFIPNSSSRLCSAHFTEDDYIVNRYGKTLLKKDAVPSLFIFNQGVKSVDPTVSVCNREMKAKKTVSKKMNKYISGDLVNLVKQETSTSPLLVKIKSEFSDVTSLNNEVSTNNDLHDNCDLKSDQRECDPCEHVTSVDRDVCMDSDIQDKNATENDQPDSSFRGTSPVLVDEPLNISNKLQNSVLMKKAQYIRTNVVSDSQTKIPVYRPALDIEECEKVLNEPLFKWGKKKIYVGHFKEEDITTPEMKNLYEVAKATVDEQAKMLGALRKKQYRMTKRVKVLEERISKMIKEKSVENLEAVSHNDLDEARNESSVSCDGESLTES